MRLASCFCCLALLSAALTLPCLAGTDLPVTEAKPEVRLQGLSPQVFDQLGKLYGVPVKVDPSFAGRAIRLRVLNADFATALRVATQLSNAFWVVQPDGSVLILSDTPENRALHEPLVERTLPLPGRTTDELTESVRLLRELLDMRLIRSDPRSSTITIRDTERRLAVAEQLLAQLQEDPGEVWVDVLLLEVDREKAQQLGLVSPDRVFAVHLGAGALAVTDPDSLLEIIRFLLERGLIPEAVLGSSLRSLLSSGLLDPDQLAALLPPFILVGGGATTFATVLPGAELRLLYLARVTRSWRRLHLRGRSGQEATVFMGERFPVVFTTFSSIFIPQIVQELIRRGQFIPPVPAVRYEDLGLRVAVTPRVHPRREISLNLKLEQAALTGQTFNTIPVISSRRLEQQVRLKEGETLIISGLRQDVRERTQLGAPGLASVPGIGGLFRRTVPTRRETELLVLITPRLVRLPLNERVAVRSLYLGTEKDFAPPAAVTRGVAEEPPPPTDIPARPQPVPRPPQPQPQQPPPPPPQN